MSKNNIKFEFGIDFQFEVLMLTLKDKVGYRAIQYYDDSYFELIEHSVIAKAIKMYFKEYKRIPTKTLLIEQTINLLKHRDYQDLVTKEDQEEILKLINKCFTTTLRQADVIMEKLSKFNSYIQLKTTLEEVNLVDYNSYEHFSTSIRKAITDPFLIADLEGDFLIRSLQERQIDRKIRNPIIPLPFKQLNDLTNAGGLVGGSIIVLLDRPKKAKTATLINIAKKLMKQRRRVLYIDIENGADELLLRMEQSMTNHTKREILSGEYNKQVQDTFKRYGRVGAELVVKEMPSYCTADDIAAYLDFLYQEYHLEFTDIVIDYLALMGSKHANNADEFARISAAYTEVRSMAKDRGIYHIYTAHHVKRDTGTRETTSYVAEDIAKCIDIVRHVQLIVGLNRTPIEEEAGFQRLEIVEQRDGKNKGRAILEFNQETQNMTELKPKAIEEFNKMFSHIWEDDYSEEGAKAEQTYQTKTKDNSDI